MTTSEDKLRSTLEEMRTMFHREVKRANELEEENKKLHQIINKLCKSIETNNEWMSSYLKL
jgi:tRNA C32,U32 (ribose-2'-O)-methylase TrmJ